MVKKLNKMRLGIVIGILLVIGLITFFSINGPNELEGSVVVNQPIIIGVSTDITGPAAWAGQDYLDGLNIALEEINNEGGVNGRPIQLIVEDNKNLPKEGVNVFRALQARDPDWKDLSCFSDAYS